MKVLVWAKKEDVKNGNITETWAMCPQPGYVSYMQVLLTHDEYIQIEDNTNTIDTPIPPCNDKKITYPEFVEKHYDDGGDADDDEGEWKDDQEDQPFAD